MISITETAATKIQQQLQKRGKGLGIRIGVKTTGCSGLAYVLEYQDVVDNTLHVHSSHDVSVFIDPKHIPYLEGLTMDYQKKGLNEGFEFINPNERDRCGCGESFRV
jgi:iron-sulfur cluster assembly protein